jgi:hypothetical protein
MFGGPDVARSMMTVMLGPYGGADGAVLSVEEGGQLKREVR